MNNTGNKTIKGTTASINLASGEFKIYGNQASTLSITDLNKSNLIKVSANPVKKTFSVNKTLII